MDFKSAAAGPGAIVYEQFGSLHLYDLKTGKTKEVSVTLAGDLPQLRQHYVNVAKRLMNADISPSGARAVFEARGEILTVPVNKGDPRNLTRDPGSDGAVPALVARWPEHRLPLGRIAASMPCISAIRTAPVDVKKIPLGEKAFYSSPAWSPDSKKIAYLDNHSHLFYIDLEQKKPVLVETDYYANGNGLAATWSPDSKWLAYSKTLKSHMAGDLSVFAGGRDKTTQVTDGYERRRKPGLRQERQVSVLHCQHELGRGDAARYRELFAPGHVQRLRGGALQERSVAAGAGKRRREEEERRQEGRSQERR